MSCKNDIRLHCSGSRPPVYMGNGCAILYCAEVDHKKSSTPF